MDWKFWLPLLIAAIGSLCQVLGYYQGKRESLGLGARILQRPHIVVGIFMLLTWGAAAFNYSVHSFGRDVADDVEITKSWGVTWHEEGKSYRLRVIADGGRLVSYQLTHRLVRVCFRTNGTRDFQDVQDVQKSALYDIHNDDVNMVLIVGADFLAPKPGVGGGTMPPFWFRET
jgi:hypothetical protein